MRHVIIVLAALVFSGCAVESAPSEEDSAISELPDGRTQVTTKQKKGGGTDCPNSGPGVYVYECPIGVSACVRDCDNAACKDTCLTVNCGCKLQQDPSAQSTTSTPIRALPVATVAGKLAP